MKENIKISLLAIIAGALIFMLWNNQTISQVSKEPINTNSNLPITSIKFAEAFFDFGTIKQNSENKYIFKFTNTGTNPLLISHADATCGCTVPTWPKTPISPGQEGEIEVMYRPGTQIGKQHKALTIVANTQPADNVVYIIANVEESKEK